MIARYTGANQRIYLTDALGSVIGQARSDQSIQNWYRYSAYGEVASATNDEGNDIEYTARENDDTGLYYYRARYYDPVLKRFISEDPIGLEGGINTCAYVEGDPISYTDPLGLLLGATVGGLQRGITLADATAVGSVGNVATGTGAAAAAVTGVAGAAGGAVATGTVDISIIGIISRIIQIAIKGVPEEAMPPPPRVDPPPIVRPAPTPKGGGLCPL